MHGKPAAVESGQKNSPRQRCANTSAGLLESESIMPKNNQNRKEAA